MTWFASVLAGVDRFGDALEDALQRIKPKIVVAFGFVVRWSVVIGVSWYLLSTMPNIWKVPLAQLTIDDLVSAAVRLGAFVGLLAWALRSGRKEYELWAYLGVAAISILYLLYRWLAIH